MRLPRPGRPQPAIRRGATRIFAYQFHGMDTRRRYSRVVDQACRDPDLWTRLQALRDVTAVVLSHQRQGTCPSDRRTYLARMAEPDLPVVRKNLSEGLYIMLDENLGGGVSLQKNIEALPGPMRPANPRSAAKPLNATCCFTPILAALEAGNSLQREAVLAAFDGSFFKGRSFARQPEDMIDVGNDREFGFLYQPELSARSGFRPALDRGPAAGGTTPGLQLASFFKLPGRTQNPEIQTALLRKLLDPNPEVREAARAIVAGDDFNPDGIDDDPGRIALIRSALAGTDESRQAILKLIGRNRRLGTQPEVVAAIRGLLNRDEAAPGLIPLLRWPVIHDAEVLAIILHAWPRLAPSERLQAIEASTGPAGPGRCRGTSRAGYGSPPPGCERPLGRGARPNPAGD